MSDGDYHEGYFEAMRNVSQAFYQIDRAAATDRDFAYGLLEYIQNELADARRIVKELKNDE